MPLRSLTIHTGDGADVDYISNVLLELGALSVSCTDRLYGTDKEQMIFETPLPPSTANALPLGNSSDALRDRIYDWHRQPRQFWRNAALVAVFPMAPAADTEQLVMRLSAEYDLPLSPSFSIIDQGAVDETRDWVRHVQDDFAPIHIGRVCIRFPWNDPETEDDDRRPNCVVTIEPGLAFGTGEHQTTQLVIQWLQQMVRGGERVLDYGCGSGVLGIVAVLLGARFSFGCDIDPAAVTNSEENARRNGELACTRTDFGLPGYENRHSECTSGYNLVVANILSQPLKDLAPLLASRIVPDGHIALTGILAEQANGVAHVYQGLGIVMKTATIKDGWALVVGHRPP